MTSEIFSSCSLWMCVWQSTILVGIGLAGSFILRSRASRAHQVLFLSMIAAVVVPAAGALVKRYELGVFIAKPATIKSHGEPWVSVENHEATRTAVAEDVEREPAAFDEVASLPASISRAAKLPWRFVVLCGWIAASSILTVRLLVSFILGARLLSGVKPLDCQIIEQAVHLARVRLAINEEVEICSSPRIRSAVMWCWRRRPVLLVPSGAGQSDIGWTGIFCHELAHYKRRDHISGLAGELAVCILPWHPFLWWARSRLIHLSEQACDDWVVATGQSGLDYAESLLNLVPGGQMAFVPAVVSSRSGLAGRVRRILNDHCGNPRAGVVWALAVSALAACLAAGVALAQTRPGGAEDRIVHFPMYRSLGQLFIQDAGAARELTYWFHWAGIQGPNWEYLCEAQGDVHVPRGKRLSLNVNQTAWRDLSWLSRLRPDDLYGFNIITFPGDPVKPSDACMPHIARLTGLKSLNLERTVVTDKGLSYLRNLKSLEYLEPPHIVTDEGLAHVAELPSLKGLYIGALAGSAITNAGLHHLGKLTSLEQLYLRGERMSDAGLAYLRDLPRLEYLCLYGSHFTDKGMVHIKGIPSLRILSFHENICQITDAGLIQISDMSNLEILCLHGLKGITDEGIAHLPKLRSLKKLNIGSSQVTDRGLSYLSQIKTLEHLDLPQDQKGITDKGLTYLGTLPNLKYLSVSRIHFNDLRMNKEYYTDKGLAELANCRLLEELNIGSIGITDSGIDHVVKLDKLKKLVLFGCENITDAGLAKLTTLKSLTNLHIAHADISIKGLNNLKPMPKLTKLDVLPVKRDGAVLNISGLTALEELGLSFEPYSQDSFVDADLKCLAELKRLRWLQIGPRDYTDKGMEYLAQLPNIERLGIGGSGLTDAGLQHLSNMKKLNHLSIVRGFDAKRGGYISGGNITGRGLRELKGLKLLAFLDIYSDDTFSDAALRRLQEELPNLSYLSVNGGMLTRINGEDRSKPTRPAAPVRQTRVRSGRGR